MIGDDDAPVTKLGICDSRSGAAGCNGARTVRMFGRFWFCARCWPHRKRLEKQLSEERKRNNA